MAGKERGNGGILVASTSFPLGRRDKLLDKRLLIHPYKMEAGGELHLFADVEVGTELTCMECSANQLVSQVPIVMKATVEDSQFQRGGGSSTTIALQSTGGCISEATIHGAMAIYCGGMMLHILDEETQKNVSPNDESSTIDKVAVGITETVGDSVPWVGSFTFGEQGPASMETEIKASMGNIHGNLMFNVLLFGSKVPR
jgi:hypothetical protein